MKRNMRNLHTTDEVRKLHHALCGAGVHADLECADGHKHVDLCIHDGKLYIEVEGPPHFLNSKQIQTDFKRDTYSIQNGFETFRIPNQYIHEHLYKLVGAIKEVVEDRKKLFTSMEINTQPQ